MKGTLVASAGVILLVVAEAVTSQLTSSKDDHPVSFMVMISLLAGLAWFLIGFANVLRKMTHDMTTLNNFVAISAFVLFTRSMVSLAFAGVPPSELSIAPIV